MRIIKKIYVKARSCTMFFHSKKYTKQNRRDIYLSLRIKISEISIHISNTHSKNKDKITVPHTISLTLLSSLD